jgi:tellurite resistance protein
MSQHELIKQGQIGVKRQARMSNVIAARSALQALINAAVYAQAKKIEDINTAELAAHLDVLTNHQELIRQLDEEIKALEY